MAEGAENVQNRIVKRVQLGTRCLLIADQAADSVERTEVQSDEEDRSDENHPEAWAEGHQESVPVGLPAGRLPDEHSVTVLITHCSAVCGLHLFRSFGYVGL